jgi:hypothetical protein
MRHGEPFEGKCAACARTTKVQLYSDSILGNVPIPLCLDSDWKACLAEQEKPKEPKDVNPSGRAPFGWFVP